MLESTRPKIVIDLANSNGDNILIDKNNLIHHIAYEKVEKLIKEHIDTIRNESLPSASNLSIFIDGTRGAGKSTFLKNATKALINSSPEYKIEKLIYIDPSKIELKEHIFLTLISQLNRIIKNSVKHTNFHNSNDIYDEYEQWRKKLKTLAGGLRLLNSEKNPYDLIDDDVFLDWGLDRADDAMQLSYAFIDLIKLACKILNKNAFIILIDDADTHFKKGEQVLEMVRRYLDMPQIIVMMAGDLKLYSNVVRGLYLGNMSENLYKYDLNRTQDRSDLLDHMEDQYLKKLFPIQSRISIKPLKQLVREADYLLDSKKHLLNDKSNRNVEITSAIDRVIQFGFHIKASSDIQVYREFILQQPLRSVLQLLQASSEIYVKELTNDNLFKITPLVSHSFRDIFLSSLYVSNVEVDKLNNGDENALIESVFDTVTKEGGIDTGCYLRPQAIDENLRNSFVALASSVAEFTLGKASTAINYMLQSSGSISLFYHIKDELIAHLPNDELQIQTFKSYCGIGQHEDALNWAWHATAVLMSKESSPSVKAGVIKLKTSPTVNAEGNKVKIVDFIRSNKNKSLPFALGLIEVIKEKKELYFSIFNVLGVMVRLLKIGEQYSTSHNHDEKSEDFSELEDKVRDCLRKLEVTLGISAPNWSQQSNGNISVLDENEESSIDESYLDTWVKALCIWLINSHKDSGKIYPSSIFLGKVWIRLYFSLIGIAETHQYTNDIGKIISLYTHCLINAFLVEESDHHLYLPSNTNFCMKAVKRENPKKSLTVVNSKLKQLEEIDFEGFPLTKIVSSCPIIQGLIIESFDGYTDEATFVSKLPTSINEISIFNFSQNSIDRISRKIKSINAQIKACNADISEENKESQYQKDLLAKLNH
uniref:P-loop NTPase fold protein n=1 Tax=Acinetobacter bereziniae TaxID=106648 RepID=UPI00125F4183